MAATRTSAVSPRHRPHVAANPVAPIARRRRYRQARQAPAAGLPPARWPTRTMPAHSSSQATIAKIASAAPSTGSASNDKGAGSSCERSADQCEWSHGPADHWNRHRVGERRHDRQLMKQQDGGRNQRQRHRNLNACGGVQAQVAADVDDARCIGLPCTTQTMAATAPNESQKPGARTAHGSIRQTSAAASASEVAAPMRELKAMQHLLSPA